MLYSGETITHTVWENRTSKRRFDRVVTSEETDRLLVQQTPDVPMETIDFSAYEQRLMALQQQIRAMQIPVVILLEGWNASGKGVMLGELLEGLDPRGYHVHVMEEPTGEERRHPAMCRYWRAMPAGGMISLFVDSWYRAVTTACLTEKHARDELDRHYAAIVQMESQLVCDGVVLLKFFLNISRKEQKKRLKELESKKYTRWRVTKADWLENEHYDEQLKRFDTMMTRTHFEGALWHVLRADHKRACKKQLYEIVIEAFESAIASHPQGNRYDLPALPRALPFSVLPMPLLSEIDPNGTPSDDDKQALSQAQKKLRKLHEELYLKRIPMVLAFEGWDAAGKGGVIRRLTSALDPRGFTVVPIASPTPEEKSHHHLWRFWNAVPKDGHIAIFDRTWYGRVMVERIEGFCTEAQWQRAYEELNGFERELAQHGAIVLKFWLQIDADEQLRRFESRQNTPEKQWKITEEDWRNREKWSEYEQAVNDMLQRTNTQYAPWSIIPANNKRYARLQVIQTVIAAMEERLKK